MTAFGCERIISRTRGAGSPQRLPKKPRRTRGGIQQDTAKERSRRASPERDNNFRRDMTEHATTKSGGRKRERRGRRDRREQRRGGEGETHRPQRVAPKAGVSPSPPRRSYGAQKQSAARRERNKGRARKDARGIGAPYLQHKQNDVPLMRRYHISITLLSQDFYLQCPCACGKMILWYSAVRATLGQRSRRCTIG